MGRKVFNVYTYVRLPLRFTRMELYALFTWKTGRFSTLIWRIFPPVMTSPLFQANLSQNAAYQLRHNTGYFGAEPHGSRRIVKNIKKCPARPPANRMYLSVYSGVPITGTYLTSIIKDRYGTKRPTGTNRSGLLWQCAQGGLLLGVGVGGGVLSIKYLFPPKKSLRYRYETARDSTF